MPHDNQNNFGPSRAGGFSEAEAPFAAEKQPSHVEVAGADRDVTDIEASRIKTMLRARVGDEVYNSWFNTLNVDRIAGKSIYASVPIKFLRRWIETHYTDDLLECCRSEFKMVENVVMEQRQPGVAVLQPAEPAPARDAGGQDEEPAAARVNPIHEQLAMQGRTQAAGFTGSPLDPRLTFETFVVGPANRMAHAAAEQVAETIFNEARGFNPLFLHAGVGNGKTHLLHAISWEVRRRYPKAQFLYLTAERFRYEFVEALQAKNALQFKDRFRAVDMLLIDDLEFLQGQATEQEFDHIINALLDSNKQLVVAASKPPSSVDRLNDRMRSRLQGGLVVEVGSPDYELRRQILERRVEEKRLTDPSFQISREVIDLLADRLTESGRELEGATTRLHAHWQCMRVPITLEIAETVIRDLMHGMEPRRIRIEEILKVVSRHFGVSRGDILSQRRHRSVVWPRQIGMYLAKQMTARSLPEIGRRFGNRDHTTVLHAIRKIDDQLSKSPRLKEEIDDLKRLLSH
ncbi:MAG: chromosomal replication initiator protein DnaA [Pseudomonadota bacterium]